MKLFRKVMAAVLLLTAISSVVMAADHDLGDGVTVKSTAKLAVAKDPFGVTDARIGGGLSVLTVKPAHLKVIAALKEADFNDATVKQFLAAYRDGEIKGRLKELSFLDVDGDSRWFDPFYLDYYKKPYVNHLTLQMQVMIDCVAYLLFAPSKLLLLGAKQKIKTTLRALEDAYLLYIANGE